MYLYLVKMWQNKMAFNQFDDFHYIDIQQQMKFSL